MDKLLTETEFYTILTDVEASINLRPLSSTSENFDDKSILPLTPSHIMLGRAFDVLPNGMHKRVEVKKKSKSVGESWKETMKISNKFWDAWKKEYLANKRKFSKQNKIEGSLKVNDLVLVLTEKR